MHTSVHRDASHLVVALHSRHLGKTAHVAPYRMAEPRKVVNEHDASVEDLAESVGIDAVLVAELVVVLGNAPRSPVLDPFADARTSLAL